VPGSPGRAVLPADVEQFDDRPLYDASIVRTVFIDFDLSDWEGDLELFHNTDVDLPATLTVDGTRYPGVGVHFRGASSYFMVPKGSKRSFNIAVDHSDPKQRLLGAKTLNLLNSNGDASMMSSVLYAHLAAPHMPTPRANFVEVVVNGQSWGVFVNVEQFNGEFVARHWPESKGDGARWKVSGSPRGSAGLDYKGEDLQAYRSRFELKTKDDPKAWASLVKLCKTLSETPVDELESALQPMLDVDGALWFLALDICLVNSDGYWVRASDYSLYQDTKGIFHLVPHDMNEAFRTRIGGPGGGRGSSGSGGPDGPGGPGGPERRGGPDDQRDGRRPPDDQRDGRQGPGPDDGAPVRRAMPANAVELDPLSGMDDETKPLRSRLLAVPALRERYLEHVRTIGEALAWENIGPFIERERALIEPLVKLDTRRLTTIAAFERAVSTEPDTEDGLRAFCERRSRYLLAPRKIADPPAEPAAPAAALPHTPPGAPSAPAAPAAPKRSEQPAAPKPPERSDS